MESGTLPQIQQDVADLRKMIESSPELKSLTRSPLVGSDSQKKALAALADQAKFNDLTKRFLMVLADNRRLADITAILKAVETNLSARRGEIQAKVESAAALTSAQQKSLEDSLGKTIGRPVAVEATVNADLIGGVVVTLGSLMIDDSIKTKLERMGRAMKHTGKAA